MGEQLLAGDAATADALREHQDGLLPLEQLDAVAGIADHLPEPVSFGPYATAMCFPMAVAGRLVVHPDRRGEGLAEQIIVARLALAWCIKNPFVSTAIMGASKVSQLEDNLKAVDVVDQLSDEVMEKIESILDNKPEPMAFQE